MFYRRFSARDGQEARQARFACEQIVKRGVKPALSHLIPNGKNSALLIIKKSQPHAAFQLLALADQFVQLRELLRGIPARTVDLRHEKIEPLVDVARYFLVLPSLIKRKQRYQPRDALDGNVAYGKGGRERFPARFMRRFAYRHQLLGRRHRNRHW